MSYTVLWRSKSREGHRCHIEKNMDYTLTLPNNVPAYHQRFLPAHPPLSWSLAFLCRSRPATRETVVIWYNSWVRSYKRFFFTPKQGPEKKVSRCWVAAISACRSCPSYEHFPPTPPFCSSRRHQRGLYFPIFCSQWYRAPVLLSRAQTPWQN
jgi:hypothetical protein